MEYHLCQNPTFHKDVIIDGYLEKWIWTFAKCLGHFLNYLDIYKCQGHSTSWTFSKCPRLLSLRAHSGYQDLGDKCYQARLSLRLAPQSCSQRGLDAEVHSHVSSTMWMPLNVWVWIPVNQCNKFHSDYSPVQSTVQSSPESTKTFSKYPGSLINVQVI